MIQPGRNESQFQFIPFTTTEHQDKAQDNILKAHST
jgi:hypothetical protein